MLKEKILRLAMVGATVLGAYMVEDAWKLKVADYNPNTGRVTFNYSSKAITPLEIAQDLDGDVLKCAMSIQYGELKAPDSLSIPVSRACKSKGPVAFDSRGKIIDKGRDDMERAAGVGVVVGGGALALWTWRKINILNSTRIIDYSII